MKANLKILDKSRYYFNVGDKVKINPKAGDFTVGFLPSKLITQQDYKGKVGVVLECKSDLHGFAQGSFYCCKADFEGEIIDTVCGAFISF